MLSPEKLGNGNLSFLYRLDRAPANEIINVAIIQSQNQNFISRGETSGKKLSHDNVVRFFQTYSAKKNDSIQMTVLDLVPDNYRIIVFVQDGQMNVTGAIAQTIL